MANNIQHGRATIKVNARVFQSKPGASIDVGGFAKTTVVTDQGVAGFTREPKPSKIECTCAFGANDSIKDFDFDDAMVEFGCDSGQVFVVRNAWTTETPQLSNDGIKITIEGPAAEEMI